MVSATLRVIAHAYLEICLLKRRPQDLPRSDWLMVLTLLAYGLSSAGLAAVDLEVPRAMAAALLDAGLLWAGTALVLYLFKRPLRTTQTVTALAGTGVVLSVVALPVVLWLTLAQGRHADTGIPALLWLGLFAWNLLISAHILRHALDSGFLLAIGITLMFVALDVKIFDVLVRTPA